MPVVHGRETRYRYAAGHHPYVKKQAGVHFYKAKKYGERAALWLRPYHSAAEELRSITELILSTENLKELVRLTNEELVETGNLPEVPFRQLALPIKPPLHRYQGHIPHSMSAQFERWLAKWQVRHVL